MATWFTSDQHFGHANIIGYCDRPFGGVQEMNAELVRRWNEVVRSDDTVYVLGDFAMGDLQRSLAITPTLVGHKILVPGNHDRCWFGHPPDARRAWPEVYLQAGFAEIRQGTIETSVAGKPVLACHFPYVGDSHDSDRFVPFRPRDEGRWLLHGHIHTSWRRRDRMVNVGVDVWDYRPVSEFELAAVIKHAELS